MIGFDGRGDGGSAGITRGDGGSSNIDFDGGGCIPQRPTFQRSFSAPQLTPDGGTQV